MSKSYVSVVLNHFANLKAKFLARGYPIQLITENLARGAALDREDLLNPNFYTSQATPILPSKPKSKAEGDLHDLAIR
jgi:hypothetical protein